MPRTSRILIIDDNRAIHDDYRKILSPPPKEIVALSAVEAALFGDGHAEQPAEDHEIISAYQGREAFEIVQRAETEGAPIAVAFVDFRMPPGWDGIETVKHLWSVAPRLQVAICTAFADYTPEEIARKLGSPKRLVVLRKPFDPLEVQELAASMVDYWNAHAISDASEGDGPDADLNSSSGSLS